MKIPKHQVTQTIIDDDIWSDYEENRMTFENWDDVQTGKMSWQWYMDINQYPSWKIVKINPVHKNKTVGVWIEENYPECKFKYERDQFLIEQSEVAMMVALKWT